MPILPVLPTHDVHDKIVEEAIEAVLSTVDLETVLARTGKLLNHRFGATRVAIHRVFPDAPGRAQIALVSDPRHPGRKLGEWFDVEGSLLGEALRTREPVVVDPIDGARPRFSEETWLAELGYGSVVSFPLLFEDEALGVLNIAHPPREGLLDCCFQVARQVAHLVAIALHNSLMVDEVRRLNRLLDRENTLLKEELRQMKRDARYVAESAAMKAVLERVRLVAPSESTVLVRGETGTGKEGLARMVHDLSPRFGAPFVVVNLGAIPDTLIESELFGHEKGAFTGAQRRKPGKFEQAEGGTIFLDEVGDAPPSVQVRLLRVLQERELQRVGGTEDVKVDVRVVAATNRDLERMVADGTFRSDLYYRLSVFPLLLPPLRERREEIRALGGYFLERQARVMHRKPPHVRDEIWAALEGQAWPGNVRELENFLQRALILSPGPELALPDLPAPAAARRSAPARADAPAAGGADGPPAPPRPFADEVREVLARALEACGGRVYGPQGAAALLGLKPTTLQGKMKKYGVTPGAAASPPSAPIAPAAPATGTPRSRAP
jgi:formate hydrogenlyase transcriptional activator